MKRFECQLMSLRMPRLLDESLKFRASTSRAVGLLL
jgi:hypothetical protein